MICQWCENKATRQCVGCDVPLCPTHAHYYVDESNAAITKASRPKCAQCAGIYWQVVRATDQGDVSVADYQTIEGARSHAYAANTAHKTHEYTVVRKKIRP